MSVPVILDCDPGHDDAFALWLAAAHPAIDLRAVTAVAGNGTCAQTSHNARVLCSVAGLRDVPVAAGADRPLQREPVTAEWIVGSTGLDGPELPAPDVPLDPRGAVALQRDVLAAANEPVVLVATGPLTNVALLLRAAPDLVAERVARIVWMGGSTGRGNTTPYAEFNAFVDPEAAAAVFASGRPISMVGLNATHQVLVTAPVRERIAAIGTRTAAFATALLAHYCASAADQPGGGPPLHDPLAVALVAAPQVVTTVVARVDVEVVGTETAGATVVDLDGLLDRPPNADVAVRVDAPAFWALIEDSLARLP